MSADAEPRELPEPPPGWQYGVVMDSGKVWGCGSGDSGRRVQRTRLRYRDVQMPCLLPSSADPARW